MKIFQIRQFCVQCRYGENLNIKINQRRNHCTKLALCVSGLRLRLRLSWEYIVNLNYSKSSVGGLPTIPILLILIQTITMTGYVWLSMLLIVTIYLPIQFFLTAITIPWSEQHVTLSHSANTTRHHGITTWIVELQCF